MFISIVILLVIFIFFEYNPTKIHFITCPIYEFTGLYCTGCGSQRSLHYLLHLNIKEALKYNPLLVILSPFLIYGIIIESYNYIFKNQIQIIFLRNNIFIVSLLIILILYTILRNINYYPFTLLMPKIN